MLINQVTGKEFLAKGKRGIVSTGFIGEKKIAIKEKNPTSEAQNRILIESQFLKKLNQTNIGPIFIESGETYLMYEFVEGEFIMDFISSKSNEKILNILLKVFDQMYTLDELKINKEEMNHPVKHVIITRNDIPVMIDFERCNYSLKPKNVTQFCQFITSSNVNRILETKKIFINKNQIIEISKKYKKSLSFEDFKIIKNLIISNFHAKNA